MPPDGHGPEHGHGGGERPGAAPDHVDTTGGHEHERVVPVPPPPDDPGGEEVARAGGVSHPVFRADGGKWRRLEARENPDPHGSFGYAGAFAVLSASDADEADFPRGTLVLPLTRHALDGVSAETVRIFRWSARASRWTLAARSAIGQTRDYVWGRVDRPGVYGLIGVHTDPLIARTVGLFGLMRGWLRAAGPELGGELAEGLCRLLLCRAGLREKLRRDPALYRALAEDNLRLGLPGPWTAADTPAVPRDPCGVCRRLAARVTEGGDGASAGPPETALLAMSVAPPEVVGRWELLPEPLAPAAHGVLPVHAALLRTGKILYFGGSENVGAQNVAGGAAIDNSRMWDPASNATEVVGSPPRHDLFCAGHALLPDGRLLAAGGTKSWGGVPHPNHGNNFEGLRQAAVFDPGAPPGFNPWTPVARLLPERGSTRGGGSWYPSLTTLPSGRVLKMAGPPEFEDSRRNNRTLEVFDPETSTWTDQGPASDMPIGNGQDLPQYPRLHVLPDGRVFCASPMEGLSGGPGAFESWIWNPATRAWSNVGSQPGGGGGFVGFDTSSVLLPLERARNYRARVLYTNRPVPRIIDLSAAAPAWSDTAPRALSDPVTGPPVRYHATAVLLPDGSVIVIGGHSDPNSWSPPVLTVERFDPATDTWSVLATAAVPRVYHSVALVLPDGRVWAAGSDYGGGSHETRVEFFAPPYLFAGKRPILASAPAGVTPNALFTIGTPDAASVRSVVLLRCPTGTHAFNIDQRWLDLEIRERRSASLTVVGPRDTALAPPGYYLLFLLDGAGVPSEGRFVRVQASAAPTIAALYPRSGAAAGGTPFTITGTNFQPGATVRVGGAAATTVTFVDEMKLTAVAPALPAGTLHDVVVTNPDLSTRTLPRGWLADFLDVPQAHMFHDAVERLFRSGVTAGCGGGNFCPDDAVTRVQMAIFLLRAEHGPGYAPPPAGGAMFSDVTAATFGAAAIERICAEGVMAGCGGGRFCPDDPVPRRAMAQMLLKAEHGPAYLPPPATGIFSDVPAGTPGGAWIERLSREGITAGCGGGKFCPSDTSTRGQMAVFLVKTFGLP